MTTTPDATPGAAPAGIELIEPPPGLAPDALADLLAGLPADVGGLTRRDVRRAADGATAVYLRDETTDQPEFGMIVVLVVSPAADADAAIANLQRTRWGDPADHTITASGAGDANTPAYREFWRSFPPGLFALPNRPVYFLLFIRAGSGYAFMVIAATPSIRSALTEALAAVF
jgi:hypothetical protein